MSRLFAALCIWALVGFGVAEAATPQDQYLQIYLLIQEADKLETAGQKASARARYEVALKRLRELNETNSDWEPTIVKYRIKYSQEKVTALEGAEDANPDQVAPPIPPELLSGGGTATPPQALPATPSQSISDSTISPDQQMNNMTPSSDMGMPVISESLTGNTSGNFSSDSSSNLDSESDPTVLKARIRELEEDLNETRGRLNTAIADAAQLRTKVAELEEQLVAARQGSDNDQIQMLMAENASLKDQLLEAQSQINMISGAGGSEAIANLQEQITKLQGQLELARKENEALQETTSEYKVKLEELQTSLASAEEMLNKPNPLTNENQVLRDIIERQLKEQARRETAKKLAMDELSSLGVEATRLKTQLDILSSPLIVLSTDELDILRKPKAELVMDPSSGSISTTVTKPSMDYSTRPRVPEEFRDVAEEASRRFAEQKFDEAAALYQSILNTYPDSLYALSNLAVVRFQQQNYPEAEKALKAAVKLAPQDAFSHSILGIVLYQQGKYDEAVDILTRAVALDANDPKTRNYLGIAASQKGWQEAAEQECRKAIELDDKYGDAHFNLAVIYATQKPPSRELARRHYQRSLELGVPRDDELEKLLQ
ncbi:MAG: tetratricopeptide repeat protein [Verrucomicrobiota bacterium]